MMLTSSRSSTASQLSAKNWHGNELIERKTERVTHFLFQIYLLDSAMQIVLTATVSDNSCESFLPTAVTLQ